MKKWYSNAHRFEHLVLTWQWRLGSLWNLRTFKRYSLDGGSILLGAGFDSLQPHLHFMLTLCFLCVDGNVSSHILDLLRAAMLPAVIDCILLGTISQKKFFYMLLLFMVIHHRNIQVTNPGA